MSWKVVGPHAVLGVEPGGIITQEIPHTQAAQLCVGGHIAEVVEDAPSAEVAEGAPVDEVSQPSEVVLGDQSAN